MRKQKPGYAGLRSGKEARQSPRPASVQSTERMFAACRPLGPVVTSKLTRWPSLSVLKPCPWIAEKWAKRSLPPSSGVTKPKPLESLNHFTVPVAIVLIVLKKMKGAWPLQGRRSRRADDKKSTAERGYWTSSCTLENRC